MVNAEALDRLRQVKNDLDSIYSMTFKETIGGNDEKRAACWAIHDQLKPYNYQPVIDFRNGRDHPDTLKGQLKTAIARQNETATDKEIKAFVENHVIKQRNKMVGPVSVSVKGSQAKVNTQKKKSTKTDTKHPHPQYISCKVIELHLAGKVLWETEDENFWDLTYEERKLIEASQLYSSCKTRPGSNKELLPVMYWKEQEGFTKAWVKYKEDDMYSKTKKENPPSWATDYLDCIKKRSVLGEKIQVFPKNKVKEPNNHPNAVYLLLCRFNRKGVPEEARVQAYAGRATNGVEKRWDQHAAASNRLLKDYRDLTTFSAEPLTDSLLVDVLVARLYAQGGREYITNNDKEEHDNIALFVYRAYGEKKTKKTTGAEDKRMVKKENKFIEKLALRDMRCGMNLKGPSEKKKKSEK